MTDFVHLHVHSAFSLLDGAAKISDIVCRVCELGQTAVALTDFAAMYGAVDFYKMCKKTGLKPIIGCEICVPFSDSFDNGKLNGGRGYKLVLLAMNNLGYRNIVKLVSLSYTSQSSCVSMVSKVLLNKYSEGVMALSSSYNEGEVACLALQSDFAGAECALSRYLEIFNGNFFLELQNHSIPDELTVNNYFKNLAGRYNVGLVATNNVHYVYKNDSVLQDVLSCIKTGESISNAKSLRLKTQEFYLKSCDEMSDAFPDDQEALLNSCRIADMCNVELQFGKMYLPKFIPDDSSDCVEAHSGIRNFSLLKQKCYDGAAVRYGDLEAHRERIEYELGVIKKMGFVDYFLVVNDFISFARENHIAVGPGRGSVAGSMVAYCLDITEIDPVKYNLFFERFLNPSRVTMPDIDIDFCYRRRGEVVDYVASKYGRNCVAQIITFGSLAPRLAVRDVGRALGLSHSVCDDLAKQIPDELHITMKRARSLNPRIDDLCSKNSDLNKVVDLAEKISGFPRHISTHAAGIVVASHDLSDIIPVQLVDGSLITQYPMGNLEELGLLKMDFLGLRNLTVIEDTLSLCKSAVDFRRHSYDDRSVYELISSGNTLGVFQLESRGMRSFMRRFRPESLEDIAAGLALYRPGPMESIPDFMSAARGEREIICQHPKLEPILKSTYGCIVYQEQVMQIARELAGYSFGRADLLRRAMSKKDSEAMDREKKIFIFGLENEGIPGTLKNGIDMQLSTEIFGRIQEFSKYAFNKSHAVAYAMLSYRTAYLKRHFPREFFTAVLSSEIDNSKKIIEYISELRRLGIPVYPPDINLSGEVFLLEDEGIRFALSAVKNVGVGMVRCIAKERERSGNFVSFEDFYSRMCSQVNKKAVEYLIKAGAFDSLCARGGLIEKFQSGEFSGEADKMPYGQLSLFGDSNAERKYKDIPLSLAQLVALERETMGGYVSVSPLDEYEGYINSSGAVRISEICEEGSSISKENSLILIGSLTAFKLKSTKRNEMMALGTLEDNSGEISFVVFPSVLENYAELFETQKVLQLEGYAEERDGRFQFVCIKACALPQNFVASKVYIKVPLGAEDRAFKIKQVLGQYGGDSPVFIFFESDRRLLTVERQFFVRYCSELEREIVKLLGDSCEIRLK